MNQDFINQYVHIRQDEMRRAVGAARSGENPWQRDRWRSRLARRLLKAAFAIESEASWRGVWEKMSDPPDDHKEPKKAGIGDGKLVR